MIKITYDAEHGIAVRDGRAESMVHGWNIHGKVEILVSTFNVIDWLRVYVKADRIKVDNLEVWFAKYDEVLRRVEINQKGEVLKWYKGFGDYETYALRLLSTSVEKWPELGYKPLD